MDQMELCNLFLHSLSREVKEEVQKFVDKEKLKHPILLKGSETGANLFDVERYPTSLWIDHQGRIIHREVDFAPEMEPAIEKRIQKCLAARNASTKASS